MSQTFKVLVVEDIMLNRVLVGELLKTAPLPLKILEAEDGQKAVEKYQIETPDLILMDVEMPKMNGLEATAAIRKLEEASGTHVTIIALTGGTEEEDKQRCLNAKMDDYLTKPLDAVKLFQKLKDYLVGAS